MDFLKKLFTNDNIIIGLCGIESNSKVLENITDNYWELNYTTPVNPLYESRKIFKYMYVD